MQKQAQDLLDKNSPALTSLHRNSLCRIVQLSQHWDESRAERDLNYWTERLRVIRWQITPGAKDLETSLNAAARHAQRAKNYMRDVFDPKHRATVVDAIGVAQTALTKATETLRQLEQAPPADTNGEAAQRAL